MTTALVHAVPGCKTETKQKRNIMFKGQEALKLKLGQVSAKTLSLGGKQFVRGRNEQKIKFQEAFTYELLSGPKHIRLLKIQEGSDTDVLSCAIFEACLDDKPSFEALSYAWDEDPRWSTTKFDFVEDRRKEERPILCNGKTQHITMNLYHALTELRRQKLQVPIWADQICINQEDGNEKAAQLAIMADIYRSAFRVTIWLGKLNMIKSQALDFMERLPDASTQVAQTSSNSKSTIEMGSLSRALAATSSFTDSVNEHYHRFTTFFVIGCRWFRRAWTLQEFMLATSFRLVMGHREVSPTSVIKAAIQIIQFYDTDYMSQRYRLNNSVNSFRKILLARATLFDERDSFRKGQRYSAEEYLGTIRTRKATQMKDKVFAGAALFEKGVPSTVNYHSTTQEIYTAYAVESLWPDTGIFMLSLVGGTVPDVEGLPTWTPNLNKDLRPQPLRYCGCPAFKAPLLTQNKDFHIDDKTLRTQVMQWDVVDAVGETAWSWGVYEDEAYNSDPDWEMRRSNSAPNERFGMMFGLLDKLGLVYRSTGERTIDAFWQTLIGGANLTSKDDLAVWRDRFQQWFAFTLVSIRANLRDQKENAHSKWSSTDKWMVPLVLDADKLEQRVSAFLNVYDPHVEGADAEPDTSDLRLRRTISHFMKRLLGAEQAEGSDSWKSSMTQILASVRREDFYDPVGVFNRHFDAVYTGRRIFVSKNGYLGIATQGVTAGDVICLIANADVPYVLRPVANKEHTFTLVGEAYVHGIMVDGHHLAKESEFNPVNIV